MEAALQAMDEIPGRPTVIDQGDVYEPSPSTGSAPRLIGTNDARLTGRVQRDSVRKLLELDFDPIEKMVELYHQLEVEMYEMRFEADGTPKRYNSVAYAQLLQTKNKVVSDLMRYGYGRVPETTVTEHRDLPPLLVKLTHNTEPEAK